MFYKFVSNFTNKLVKQLLSMTVYIPDDKDTHWLGFGGVYICEGVVGSMTISLTFPSRSGGETDKVADIIIGVLGPDNGEDL